MQKVNVNNKFSSLEVIGVVPYGSILGPLLVSVFIMTCSSFWLLVICVTAPMKILYKRFIIMLMVEISITRDYFRNWGQRPKDTKKGTFSLQKIKKGTPILASPYLYSLFTIVLIKQSFEKNKSLRAASRSRTQF